MKLFLCGKAGENYGWGTCLTNLRKYLAPLCDLEIVESKPSGKIPGVALIPIADYKLNPIFEVQAEKLIGYCFTEPPMDEDSVTNAARYDFIFAGSTWNKQRILDAGIKTPCAVLLQGIDHSIFKPQPPAKKRGFVVFSGGKYEFRKGQDYVITAMRHFMAARQDVVLITAWFNHWKASERSMECSWLIDPRNPLDGLPADRVISLPLISHAKCAEVYAMSHVGLFPNRCEAGTNLVMMEYMACARPVIASYATGHKDVLPITYPLSLKTGSYDPAGWFNPEISDIICALEYSYRNRAHLNVLGNSCAKRMKKLTWERCAEQIIRIASSL